jgi:hypothetical protein
MTKEEFVALSLENYEKLQQLNQIDDFYTYEKTFEHIWTEFGRQSLQKSIGDVPVNAQKKTLFAPDMAK